MLSQMSTRPLGRISAGAAPFALASATALSLLYRVPLYVHAVLPGGVDIAMLQDLTVLWIIASLFAALGRWGAARGLALAATAVDIAILVLFHTEIGNSPYLCFLWCNVALGVIALTAPADLVDRSLFSRAEALATCAALGLGVVELRDIRSPLLLSMPWPLIVLATAFAIHLAQPGSDSMRARGIVLAAVPWATVSDPWTSHAQATKLMTGTAILAALFISGGLIASLVRVMREARVA